MRVPIHRTGTDVGDRPSGRYKGHRNGDDFVTWSNTAGEKRQVQGTGPGVDANAVENATVARENSASKAATAGPEAKAH